MDEITKPCRFLLEKEVVRFKDRTKITFNQLNTVLTNIKKMERHYKSDGLDNISKIIDRFIDETKAVISSDIEIEENVKYIMGEIEMMLIEGSHNNIKILPLNSELKSDYYVTYRISEFIKDTLINAVSIISNDGTISVELKSNVINEQTYIEIHISITGCDPQPNIYDSIFDFRKSKYGLYGFWFAQQLLKILDGEIKIADKNEKVINFVIVLPGYSKTQK